MARRSRFVRPAPRTKMWIGVGVGGSTIAASTTLLKSTLSAGALLLRPFTVIRTHIDILVASDQLAVNERVILSYGRLVVTDTAAALGITALPNPSGISGDPEADWHVWQSLIVQVDFLSSVGIQSDAGHHYTVDSKAMRKVGPDDNIVTLVGTDVAVGAEVTDNGRMLIQLH